MPLWLLASIVALGLGAVWLAMRAMRFDREMRLRDATHAGAEWMADNPGSEPDEVLVAQGGRAALVRAGGRWGLLWVMGQDTASHALDAARTAAHRRGLEVRLGDFAAPRVVLDLTEAEQAQWRATIEGATWAS